MISVFDQVRAFALTIGIGGLIGVLFDLYRAWRYLARPNQVLTYLGDALVWLVLTPTAFYLLLLSNGGELRFYVFLGLVLGFGLHLRWMSRKTVFFWRRMLYLVGRGWRLGVMVTLFPGWVGKKILPWPLGLLSLGLWHFGRVVKILGRQLTGVMALSWRRWTRGRRTPPT